jgi:adenosylcobinamide-phosphate synthase
MLFLFPGGIEPLLLILVALALSAAVGDLPGAEKDLTLPRRVIRRGVAELERRLNRSHRNERTRFVRGQLVAAVIVVAALAIGLTAAWLFQAMPYGRVLELAALLTALSLQPVWNRVRKVAAALETGSRDSVREAARCLTWRPPDSLDDYGAARVAVEAAADAVSRRVVAPSLWYGVFGLPGLLLWIAGDAVAPAGGGRMLDPFGAALSRLGHMMEWLPSRIAGLLIVAASVFVGSAEPAPAFKTLRRYGHLSGNGWPAAAMAGALGLALGGPRREGEVIVSEPWIGDGRARVVPADVRRAVVLFAVAGLILAALVAGLVLILGFALRLR